MWLVSVIAVVILVLACFGAAVLIVGLRTAKPQPPQHPTHNDWVPFVQGFDYYKKFYDVRLPDGQIYEQCWPNAGCMNTTHGEGKTFRPSDNILVRLSKHQPCEE